MQGVWLAKLLLSMISKCFGRWCRELYAVAHTYLALNYCVLYAYIYHTALWSSDADTAKASIASMSSSVHIKIGKAHSVTTSCTRFCLVSLTLSMTVEE